MSMCNCSDCGAYIDSDDDPDCFVEVGNMRRPHKEIILCERCRDEREQYLREEHADFKRRQHKEDQMLERTEAQEKAKWPSRATHGDD